MRLGVQAQIIKSGNALPKQHFTTCPTDPLLAGFVEKPAIVSAGNRTFSAGRGYDDSWSNSMRLTGQGKCKWGGGKSVRLTNR